MYYGCVYVLYCYILYVIKSMVFHIFMASEKYIIITYSVCEFSSFMDTSQ
jgi:hypothetical protein